ncbi:MAG TPA: hypothetical protein V6D35_12970 [Candidatus Sericytochromatia bacterium]
MLRLSLEKDTTESCAALYDRVRHNTTTLAANSDRADIYYPLVPNSTADRLPIAVTSGWDFTG